MLFNSFEYIFVFLPLTFLLYFYLNSKKLVLFSRVVLVFASLFFYSWWNIIYLPLLLFSLFFNYGVGVLLIREKKYLPQKTLLSFGVIVNVALLGYFKYADFFLFNINFVFGTHFEYLRLLLPLAISFFTFQQIAYLVDSYRGEVKEPDFLNYATFVTFFPQLIAGPIVHHKEMMPQFANLRNKLINYKHIALGLFIFSVGLFKKVVLADTLAVWGNYGFDEAMQLNFVESSVTLLAYSFQLYFDFSGYTDMAMGAALLFNIKLPQNFNSPYKATSVIDIWDRWHMTLSRFINKYVFRTIVKSFKSYTLTKGMIAVFLSMMVSGVWHGAGWTFVIFGAIHGIALVTNHLWKKKIKIRIPKLLGWLLTFFLWNFALIFFRATSIDDALKVIKGFINFDSLSLASSFINLNEVFSVFPLLLGSFFIILTLKNSNQLLQIAGKNSRYLPWFCLLGALCFGSSLIVMSFQTGSEFLYFNF